MAPLNFIARCRWYTLVKPEDIKSIHDQLNSFDPNLRYTVDCFEEEDPHFLDLWIIENNEVKIYRKQTNTGLHVNFDSYVPWNFRKSWITSLVTRAKRIFSPPMLPDEILTIKKFGSWNGFPKVVLNKIVDNILQNNSTNEHQEDKDVKVI